MAKPNYTKQLQQLEEQDKRITKQIDDLQKRRRQIRKEKEDVEQKQTAELGNAVLQKLNLSPENLEEALKKIEALGLDQQPENPAPSQSPSFTTSTTNGFPGLGCDGIGE